MNILVVGRGWTGNKVYNELMKRGSDVTTTLNLPTPSLSNVGRDLIVSVRTAHAVNSATQVIVDIEADPNGVSPSPQFSVLPAIAGAWTHLVSNGTYWVSVAKSNF